MTFGTDICADCKDVSFVIGIVTKAALILRGNGTDCCKGQKVFVIKLDITAVFIAQEWMAGGAHSFFSAE